MARFIKLAITDLNDDGEPLVSDRDEWINLDQVTSIRIMLGNNLARRHQLGGSVPRAFYPLIEIHTTDRRIRLISLGTHPDAPRGMAALHGFLPALVDPPVPVVDLELAQLLGTTSII